MILNSSNEGDMVLDTFAGSGTTAIACYETKRLFTGFEIDDDTFKVAVKRIQNETSQTYLF